MRSNILPLTDWNRANYRESIRTTIRTKSTCFVIFTLSFLNVLLLATLLYRGRNAVLAGSSCISSPYMSTNGTNASLEKPKNIPISGLVFFGRRDRVKSMNCYIERNMVDNGGWLDEVLWVVNTKNSEDLKYVEEIIASSPRYKKLDIGHYVRAADYRQIWKLLQRETIYVKIDDDVLWLADDTIPLLVDHKIKHPDDFAVSANVINNPPLGFMHYHFGALHPYFPELDSGKPSQKPSDNKSWKWSDHPYWEGPEDFEWSLNANPPAKGHRWLRVKQDKALARTPATQLKYEVWGTSYSSWAITAQQHYSFLENLETDQLHLYKFDPPWNMDNERIRINVLAIWSDDILDSDIDKWPAGKSDEDMIVMELPKRYNRPVNILGQALAVHFSYQHQPAVEDTDLLDRYRALALERGCIRKK